MKRIALILLAMGLSTPVLAKTAVQCKSTVKGKSGSGTEFIFHNHLVINLGFGGTLAAKYYSEIQGNSNLEDAGVLKRVTAFPSDPDQALPDGYIAFSGADKIQSGSLSFAMPMNELSQPSGSKFKGIFQTVEDDTGAKNPIVLNMTMDCVASGAQ